jgi:hypothetical protein
MTIQVMTAVSTSTNVNVYFNRSDIPGTSVTTGLTNAHTFNIMGDGDVRRDTRITIAGTFGSGSASGNVVVDISPGRSGNFYFPLFSVSSNFTTAIPIQADHVIRIRTTWTSAAAAIGMSIDAFIG